MNSLKRINRMSIVLIAFVIFVSCNNKSQSAVFKKIEPNFDVAIHISKDSFISYTIKTNLPEETIIGFSILDKDSEMYLRQDENEINNGSVTFGPYENLQNLEPGEYIGEIMMPVLFSQKDSVRKILGENGENLIGQSVIDVFDTKVIEQRFGFTIPE